MKKLLDDTLPVMSTGEVVDQLTNLYENLILNGKTVSDVPSVMLWGPPGVGKSQAVHQIADNLSKKSGKTAEVKDVRLLLFNPIDLRGIPTANQDKTLAVWLKPEIFDMDASDDVINVLFLDEISSAPPSVQAAAYQITLDRVVGEHQLPDNCIVIAAGNRVTDKSVAYKMPKALANRLLHLNVSSNFESWRKWAVTAEVHPKVLAFLSFRQDCLMMDAPSEDVAFPTPRSWEMVSNLLKCGNDSIQDMFPMIAGLVGIGAAVEFRTWETVYHQLPAIEDIFAGKNPSIPKTPDCLYALTAAMIDHARRHKPPLREIGNSIAFADRMPPDFAMILMQDYMHLSDDFRLKLLRIPEFNAWMQSKGALLNGTV